MIPQIKILVAVVLLSSFGVNAQTPQDHDPKAKAILDGVSAKNKTNKTVHITFRYSMDNKQDDIHESQEGTLLLQGQKFKLELGSTVIYCDGITQWNHLVDNEEVQITEPEYEEGTLSPTNIFTIYEKGFKYQFIKEEVKDGKTLQYIKLFPEDANDKPYHTIKLYVDKVKKQLDTVIVVGKEGDNYTYKILKLVANPPTSPSDFKFDTGANPDIEIIDLRD